MRQAQSTLEYVCLVAIVAAAIIATLAYISRGFQGRLRTQADQLGEQYSPKNMDTAIKEVSEVVLDETIDTTTDKSKTNTKMRSDSETHGHERFER